MNLGIVADEISRDFGEAVRIGKSLGIERYEIRFLKSGRVPICDKSELLEIEQIVLEERVEITALSPGLFKWTESEEAFKNEMNEVFPRSVELAERWNLSNLITFGFHKPNTSEKDFYLNEKTPSYVFDWFNIASESAKKSGLRLLVEPEPICWMDTGTRVVEVIKEIDSENIAINYDPGNVAWLLEKDPFDEFERISPYIQNVHIKDLKKVENGNAIWAIPGEGIINFQKHLKALQEINYNGNISLEPHLDGSEETTRLCKIAVESLWK